MNEKENSLRTIFVEAVEISDAVERGAFLQRACGDDVALRQRIERLLKAHDAEGGFTSAAVPPDGDLPATEKPGDRIGRYKLREQIGKGGCGVVYVAEQEEPVRRHVALKVIKLGMDTKQVVARFEAERQALAMMDHPNIAKVLDAGATDTGRPYFVMELVRGIKITDYCDQHNLSTEERLDLLVQVCRAIQHAHQKGIIHRDIKPSNILVTLHDGLPVPKVIDFGIAKATEGRLTDLTVHTELNQFIGTPAYMSPEQAQMGGLDIDTRSDIYSLGVLLYELLTGRTPFDARTLLKAGLDQMRRIIREQEPVKPSTRLGTLAHADLTEVARHRQVEAPRLIHVIRGDLDWIVMKALEKDRARRYETANGFAMDLQRHLQNEPVIARPPNRFYQFQKLAIRNKLPFAAASTVAAALLIGLGLSTWLFFRERAALKAADENAALAAQQARRAEASANENRERLVRLNVANGVSLLNEGDHFNALLWFAEAFKLEEDRPDAVAHHRLRLASTLQLSPKLRQLWFTGQPETRAGFSRDGRLVLSGSQKATTCAWDAASGEPIASPLSLDRPGALVGWLDRFSSDGHQVLGVETNQVWLREVSSGRHVQRFAHPGVRGACFNPEGDRVFTWSTDGRVLSWNPTTGQLFGPAIEHGRRIARFTVSRDGWRVLTVATNAECQVWDTRTGQRSGKAFLPSTFPFLTHVGFNREGDRIVTADDYGFARVWDAATGEPVIPPIQTSAFLFHAGFSPDAERLVTSGLDRSPKIWDARTGGLLLNLIGHKDSCSVAAFSLDGKRVATGNKDRTVRVWEVASGRLVSPILSHSAFVQTVEFHPNGHQLVTACDDGTVRLWDLGADDSAYRPWEDTPPRVVAVTADGQRLMTQDDGKRVQVWDSSTWKAVGVPLTESNEVFLTTLDPGSRQLLAVGKANNGADWEFNLWDVTSGRLLTSSAATTGLHCVARSRGGEAWVAILRTNAVEVWKLRADGIAQSALLLPQETKAFRDMDEPLYAAISPDGQSLVTLEAASARVWHVATGQQRFAPLRHTFPVFFAEFSPDSRLLVTTCADAYLAARPAQVWNAQTGQPIGPPLSHNDGILFARFSPDGASLLTGSEDATARLRRPLTGAPVAPPLRHKASVNWGTFDREGQRVLTGCVDGDARLWDAHTGEPLTPYFAHVTGPVEAGGILADGQVLLTRSGTNWVFRRLPADSRSAEDWQALAQLLAGHRLDATGTLEPAGATILSNLLVRLRP